MGSGCILLMAIYYIFQSNTPLGISLILTSIGLPIFQSYDSFEYFWNGKKNFKKSMSYNAASTIIPLLLLIITLLFSKNLIIIIGVFISSNALSNYIFTKKTLSETVNDDVDSESFDLGKKLTIIQGIETLNTYVDKIFIWSLLGSVNLAIYSFAQIPISKMQQLAPIQILSLPKLSTQDIKQEKTQILKNCFKLFIVSILITSCFIKFIPLLFNIFFPEYIEAIRYSQFLGLLLLMIPFTYINTAMVADSRGNDLTVIQTISLVLKLILFCILVPTYQIWGIIFTTILTELIKNILLLSYFIKGKTIKLT